MTSEMDQLDELGLDYNEADDDIAKHRTQSLSGDSGMAELTMEDGFYGNLMEEEEEEEGVAKNVAPRPPEDPPREEELEEPMDVSANHESPKNQEDNKEEGEENIADLIDKAVASLKTGAKEGEESEGEATPDSDDSESDSDDAPSSSESGERTRSLSKERSSPLTGAVAKKRRSSDSDKRTPPKHKKARKSGGGSRDRRCGDDDDVQFFFEDARYFLIKSANQENVILSKAKGVWATTSRNESNLNRIFRKTRNVILIFSVERSQGFQGFARLASESAGNHSPVQWVLPPGLNARNLGGIFKLHWLNRKELPFKQTTHLCNPYNENKPVKIGRDGTEIAPKIGEKVCSMFPVDEGLDVQGLIKRVRRLQDSHPHRFAERQPRYSDQRRVAPRRRHSPSPPRRPKWAPPPPRLFPSPRDSYHPSSTQYPPFSGYPPYSYQPPHPNAIPSGYRGLRDVRMSSILDVPVFSPPPGFPPPPRRRPPRRTPPLRGTGANREPLGPPRRRSKSPPAAYSNPMGSYGMRRSPPRRRSDEPPRFSRRGDRFGRR